MDAQLVGALTAAAGVVVAAITGVLGYRSARWSLRRDLEVELRTQRLAAFKKLWALGEPLARYGRPSTTALTAGQLETLSFNLSHWYYTEGGMFLSDNSRNAYFAFQEALRDEVGSHGTGDEVDDATRARLREKASDVRDSFRSAFKGFPRM